MSRKYVLGPRRLVQVHFKEVFSKVKQPTPRLDAVPRKQILDVRSRPSIGNCAVVGNVECPRIEVKRTSLGHILN